MASSSCTTPTAHSLAAGLWTFSDRSASITAKEQVKLQYGGVCWLCETPYPPIQIAHNIDASIEIIVVSLLAPLSSLFRPG